MKIEVCDVCKKEDTLYDNFGFRTCGDCGAILYSMWQDINDAVRKRYSEPQKHLATVVNWIKSSNREKLKEYFGTAGLEILDKLKEGE